MASGKVDPRSRIAHWTSPGASCVDEAGCRASRRACTDSAGRRGLDRDAVVRLVADQHAGLAGAQQVGHDRQRDATALDLEGAVALAVQDQHVAEAVAHQQIEQAGSVPGTTESPVASSPTGMLNVCRKVPLPLPV